MLPAHFDHDCTSCVFLGTTEYEGNPWDAYACPQSGFPTVVLRFGDDGPDYISGVHLVARLPDDLAEKAQKSIDGWRSERRDSVVP